MIVEFTGPTGVGKTTITQQVAKRLRGQGIPAFHAYEFILRKFGLGAKPGKLRSLLVDLLLLPTFLMTARRHGRYFAFARQQIFGVPGPFARKLNKMRNVIKQICVFEFATNHDDPMSVIILDEGVIHAAHLLFVHRSSEPVLGSIPCFVELLPLPKIVFILEAPAKLILERTMNRPDPPYRNLSPNRWQQIIDRALTVFKILEENPRLDACGRKIPVGSAEQNRTAVDTICATICAEISRKAQLA